MQGGVVLNPSTNFESLGLLDAAESFEDSRLALLARDAADAGTLLQIR